jgi:16S rRNA (guanine527-N7)-methyltransferase
LDRERFVALLQETSGEVGVSLSIHQAEQFLLYLQELLSWNRRFNLTAITDPDQIVIKHFVDSLTPLPFLGSPESLLDLGSGAGFPGLPLKIASPGLQVNLVDGRGKKISFLKHLIRTLALTGISAIHCRMEELPQRKVPFQTLISRAFRRPEPLLEAASVLLGPGTKMVVMLGPTTREDQVAFRGLAAARGLELSRVESLELPRGRGRRTLLFFTKTQPAGPSDQISKVAHTGM